MALNRSALKISLDSLVEEGNQYLQPEDVRAFVVFYNDTLRYMSTHLSESEALKELYPKFPGIELKEFNKPVNKIVGFAIWFLGVIMGTRDSLFSGNGSPMTDDPEWQAYYKDILEKCPVIQTIASELIMRMGE